MIFVEWQQEENRGADGDWVDIYKFTLEPRCFQDFVQMCQYYQTSLCFLLVCKSLCLLCRANSKVTYIGRRLKTTKFPAGPGGKLEITTRELKDEEMPGILAEMFGIILKSPLVVKDEAIMPPEVIY